MATASGSVFRDEYSYVDPMMAQHTFASKYDLDNPAEAASTYARYMVQHTRQQLQSINPDAAAAANFSPRRSSQATSMSTTQDSYQPANLTPGSSAGGARSPDS